MLSNTFRIVLLIIGFLIALFFATIGYWLQFSVAVVFVILIVLGYFLNGTIFLTLRKLSKNDFEGAERMLKMTRYPRYLARLQKAYYYMLMGLIEARKGNYILASTSLETALAKGLRTLHDKTIVLLNLSSIYYNLGNKEKALQHLNAAKMYNTNQGLEAEIEKLEHILR